MTRRTTINIKKELADAFKMIKQYPHQTYDEIIESDPRLKNPLRKLRKKLKEQKEIR